MLRYCIRVCRGREGGGGLWELDGVWCLVLVKVYVPVFIYIVSKLKRS